ncbi:hypothetical protein GGR56DRAFT_663051 [Xylariaceae sp. FL0804]|nr:hypothetical protein GGR56DRAFT_663051 [Xylariaceae sp. FL0804]
MDSSARGASLEVAIRDNLVLEDRLAAEAQHDTVETRLQRFLSLRSLVSTSSSAAERNQAAVGTNVPFREIGTDSIGKVFEHPGTLYVYKLPLLERSDKIWNNYVMNQRVEVSFSKIPFCRDQVEIPRSFWDIFCMERIFPLPLPVRDSLIEKYCPKNGQDSARASKSNKDCLVRPMLGRRKFGGGMSFFSLRNFKLHVNQVEELNLEVDDIAQSMGHAMAVLHWHTGIDALDIEFVLGSSPHEDQRVRTAISPERLTNMKPGTSTFEDVTHPSVNFGQRIISLWLLDFDACRDMPVGPNAVSQAVKAFLETDPYCPRPSLGDQMYVATGEKIMHGKYPGHALAKALPAQFVKEIERIVKSRSTPGKSSAGQSGTERKTPTRQAAHRRGGSCGTPAGSQAYLILMTYLLVRMSTMYDSLR